jgi:hypothetical protein
MLDNLSGKLTALVYVNRRHKGYPLRINQQNIVPAAFFVQNLQFVRRRGHMIAVNSVQFQNRSGDVHIVQLQRLFANFARLRENTVFRRDILRPVINRLNAVSTH